MPTGRTITILVTPALAKGLQKKATGPLAKGVIKLLRANKASLQPIGLGTRDDSGSTYLTVVVDDDRNVDSLAEELKKVSGVQAAFAKPGTALP